MELILEKTVNKKMLIDFLETFFASWINNKEKDEEKVNNKGLLDFLPKNVMWEIKPLAEKQLKKILKAAETGTDEQFTEIFDNLAEDLAYNYWEKELSEVNLQSLPTFAFCQMVYKEASAQGNSGHSTYARFLLGQATSTFELHPDPFSE